MWFVRTFGISLCAVEVKDDAGVYHTVSFTDEKQKSCRLYEHLSDEEKDMVKQTVVITDTFCVSEAAYHELTMVQAGGDLPQSYLVEHVRTA